MLRTLFKIAAIVVLLFALFKGAEVWATLRFADHLNACTNTAMLCRLVQQKAPAAEIGATMRETFACVRDKQSWIERKLVPLAANLRDPTPTPVDFGVAAGLCK